MTDISDQATEQEEKARAAALEIARNRKSALVSTGFCYNCEEPLLDGMHFCDVDCRDDWQKRQRSFSRN